MRAARRGSSGSSGSSDSTSLVSNALSPIPEEHNHRAWTEWPSSTPGIQPPAYSVHSDYDSYLDIDDELQSDSGSSSIISFSVIADQFLGSDSIKNSETPNLSTKFFDRPFDPDTKMENNKDDNEVSTLRVTSESTYDSDDASSPRTPKLRRFKTHENLRQAIESDKLKVEDVSKITEIHQPLKRHPAMSPNTWKKEFSQVSKTVNV